jgi:hypothetical protein
MLAKRVRPIREHAMPFFGRARQGEEASPRILCTLRVVGGGCQHGMRPIACPLQKMLMELFGIDAEAARITAYLVQCNEPAIAVEHRVLGAFRHHRRGDLLKLSSDTLLGQLRNMADHVFVAGGRAKMSKHSVRGGDVAGLLGRFKLLQEKAQARTGKLFPVVAIFERMSNQWREEQNRCLREIERLQAADRSYMDEGVQLPELARNGGAPRLSYAGSCRKRGGDIDSGFRDVCQRLVSRPFFLEVPFQETCTVVMPELLGPGDERAVAADFIMLNSLRRSD